MSALIHPKTITVDGLSVRGRFSRLTRATLLRFIKA